MDEMSAVKWFLYNLVSFWEMPLWLAKQIELQANYYSINRLIFSIIIFKDRLWWMISALNGTRASFLPQFESDRRALSYQNKLT